MVKIVCLRYRYFSHTSLKVAPGKAKQVSPHSSRSDSAHLHRMMSPLASSTKKKKKKKKGKWSFICRCRFMNSATPTHWQAYTMVRALRPVNASPDWKLPTVPEIEPLKRQRSLIYARLCQKERNSQPSADQLRLFYSQPRQLPCARHPVLKPAHLFLSHF